MGFQSRLGRGTRTVYMQSQGSVICSLPAAAALLWLMLPGLSREARNLALLVSSKVPSGEGTRGSCWWCPWIPCHFGTLRSPSLFSLESTLEEQIETLKRQHGSQCQEDYLQSALTFKFSEWHSGLMKREQAHQWKTSVTPFSVLSRGKRSSFQRKFSFISILFSYTLDYFVLINISQGW